MMSAKDWSESSWALVDDNDAPVIEFRSFIDADITIGGKVVSEAIEQGSFASYNKTKMPVDIMVTLAIDGTPSEISQTLGKLRALQTEPTLFRLMTPEAEFKSLTLESYDYKRDRESGLNIVYISLHLVEVVQVETLVVGLPARSCRRADCASTQEQGQKKEQSLARHIADSVKKYMSGT